MKHLKSMTFNFILYFGMIWASTAISIETYMLYLYFSNQNKKIKVITNKVENIIDKIR
jgi:hypothetical protein